MRSPNEVLVSCTTDVLQFSALGALWKVIGWQAVLWVAAGIVAVLAVNFVMAVHQQPFKERSQIAVIVSCGIMILAAVTVPCVIFGGTQAVLWVVAPLLAALLGCASLMKERE